jgi:hypothetical protein
MCFLILSKAGDSMIEAEYALKGKDKEMVDMVKKYIRNKELDELQQIQEHKCFNCVWSRWCGTKFTCMFTRCLKSLRPIK